MNQTQYELLSVLSAVLFDARQTVPELSEELKKEALAHSVYSLLPLKKDALRTTIYAGNIRSLAEHRELHELLSAADIPYVILKGWASARYYPEPLCRSAGDVDFLLRESDFPAAEELLQTAGFRASSDRGGNHIGFHRPPRSHWEMHRRVNGSVEVTERYFATLPEEAQFMDGLRVPSDFHHCLILLCHTASHLTKEGIGLRQLCDWAVFVNRVDASQWEAELKDCGLWMLAKTLSLLSVRYLHLPRREWFGTEDGIELSAFMEDIFTAGNFGKKDRDRYRQIKYVAGEEHQIDKANAIRQGWNSLSRKAKAQGKSRGAVLADYVGMLLRGERKIDTPKTLSAAAQRRSIYRELRLFEREEDEKL